MHDIIELWHWRVTDKVSRRHFITRHRMTQADALDFDPAAERVEGSLERRVVRGAEEPVPGTLDERPPSSRVDMLGAGLGLVQGQTFRRRTWPARSAASKPGSAREELPGA